MKFTTYTSALRDVIAIVSQVIKNGSTLPVLSYMLVEAKEDGTIRIAGTDLENYMSLIFHADVLTPGSVCLPCKTVIDILAGVKSCSIQVEANVKPGRCKIGDFTVGIIDALEFPPMPMGDRSNAERLYDSGWNKMWTHELYNVISQVSYARSSDAARPVLMSVLLGIRNDKFCATCSDGFRVATNDPLAKLNKEDVGIYGSAIAVIEKQMKGKNTTPLRYILWKYSYSGKEYSKFVMFEWKVSGKEYTAQATLYGSVMEGNFPPYQTVIPFNLPFRLSMDKNLLLDAIKSVEHIMKGKDATHVVYLLMKKENIEILASNDDVGVYKVLPAEINLPEDLVFMMAFNSKFMEETLERMPSSVYMRFQHPASPAIFVGADFSQVVLMPMHTGKESAVTNGYVTPEEVEAFEKMLKEMAEAEKQERAAVEEKQDAA